MRRLSLGASLGVLALGLVTMSVLVMGIAAHGVLRELADEDARSRVALGAASAAESVHKAAADLTATASLLAERPTLARLVAEQDTLSLHSYLDRFAATSGLTGCIVRRRGQPIGSGGGAALAWDRVGSPTGAVPVMVADDGGAPLLLARAELPTLAAADVVVARRLDAGFEHRLSDSVGLPITIFRTDSPAAPHLASLRDDALQTRRTVSDLVDSLGVYVAVAPMPFTSGTTAVGLQATFERGAAEAPVRRLSRELVLWAVAIMATAALVALILARRASQPIAPLVAATTRIGRGDFTSPIPRAHLSQIDALGTAMEDMRVRLLRLTAELRRRQADAEAVLGGIAEGVFTVDENRRIRYLNPQATAMLGVDSSGVVGRFCGDVLNPRGPRGERPCEEDCPIVHARFRGGARAVENLVLPGGHRRTVVITSAPPTLEPDSEGGPSLQFQLIRDETDVEATRKLRDTLVANISHEFRTPLSAQLASIEMLRERSGDLASSDAQDLLRAVERGTLRLTRLIDNLLESLRIEAGQDSVRRMPVALDQVVEEAVELTGPLLEQRQQRLAVELPYPLPEIMGDAPRLTQAIVNLLANANKFAPAGSAVRVGGAVHDEEVELWVEDEGPGLPEGGARAIFERFVRAPGEEPEESGMGLGLWIVKSIAERHGGRVEAKNLGPGTRVTVVVPRG